MTINELTTVSSASMITNGLVANEVAGRYTFDDYQSRKSANTLRRQQAELDLFAQYLAHTGVYVSGNELFTRPEKWTGLTWGITEAFIRWQLNQGYAVGSVNCRLSTVKTYAALAAKAGIIPAQELILIKGVAGFAGKEQARIDSRRQEAGLSTRVSTKKSEPVALSDEQVELLLDQPDTPVGRRDAFLLALMVHLGLRVGEVAGLKVADIDLKKGRLTFYRPKVAIHQTHNLNGALPACYAYMLNDAPESGPLFRGSRKGGLLTGSGWSVQKMTQRVQVLGQQIGIPNLSPHDLRHFWATRLARSGVSIDRLMSAGGWSNPVTPLTRYIKPAEIANEGVTID